MSKTYTITGKKDGFGSQYQAIMSGIAYSYHKNLVYIHSPMKKISHGGNPNQLNKFIGIKNSQTNYEREKIDISEPYNKIVHTSKNPSEFYTHDVLQIIRNFYYSTAKPEIPKLERPEICIHIRRGDVTLEKHPKRFVSLNKYREIIGKLLDRYPNYKIALCSEASAKDELSNFLSTIENREKIQIIVDESTEQSFHRLVTAEVLVTSKSSFSYSAAILNKNIIYYIPFWHAKLNHWQNI